VVEKKSGQLNEGYERSVCLKGRSMRNSRLTQFSMILFALLFLGIAPPFVGAFFTVGSYAPGIILSVSLIFVFLFRFLPKLLSVQLGAVFFVFLLMFWSLAQILVSGGLNERAIFSLLPFIVLVITAKLVSLYWVRVDERVVRSLVVTLVAIGGVLAVANFLSGFELGRTLGYPYNKSIFPFGEPSHFALFFGAFWLAFCLIVDRADYFIWGGVYFLMAILLPSVSLLIYMVILMAVSLRFTLTRVLGFSFTIACIVLWALNSSYLLSRVNFSGGVNLSGLVYLQGAIDAYNCVCRTFGLGLGFQMLGTQPPSDISLEIARILEADEATNRFDGGFLAAKLVAEFGVLGILLIALYLRCAVRSLVWLRGVRYRGVGKLKELLCHCIVLGFSVELFVRGIGYFSAGVFLFFVAIFYLARNGTQKHLDSLV